MAKTTKSTSDNLTRKVWNERLYREIRQETFFDPFTSEGENAIVQEKSDLTKQKGDNVRFGLTYALSGDGVTGNTVLSGREEAMTDASFSVTLERYRHAVIDDGDLSRRRPVYDMNSEMRSKLKLWMAEKIDQLKFNALGIGSGSATGDLTTKVFYNNNGTFTAAASHAAAKTAMHATNTTITAGATSGAGIPFIVQLKAWAETGGGGSGTQQYIPIQPIKHKGRNYYIALVHPDVLVDLKTSANYNQMVRDARERAQGNPLFESADCLIDDVLIYPHFKVYSASDGGGASVRFSRNALLGKQALAWAWGEKPNTVEEETDYQEFYGYAIRMTAGVAKTQFNSKDYGVLGFYMAMSNITGQ